MYTCRWPGLGLGGVTYQGQLHAHLPSQVHVTLFATMASGQTIDMRNFTQKLAQDSSKQYHAKDKLFSSNDYLSVKGKNSWFWKHKSLWSLAPKHSKLTTHINRSTTIHFILFTNSYLTQMLRWVSGWLSHESSEAMQGIPPPVGGAAPADTVDWAASSGSWDSPGGGHFLRVWGGVSYMHIHVLYTIIMSI